MTMCEGCTDGRHWDCGMQTWCQCDCPGPEGMYLDPDDPDAGFTLIEDDGE